MSSRCAVLDSAATPQNDSAEPTPEGRDVSWRGRYVGGLILLDAGAIACAVLLGIGLRFQTVDLTSQAVPYPGVTWLLVVGWLLALQGSGAYEVRHVAAGAEELKRVARGSLVLAGCTAVVCYVGALSVARGFVGIVVPIGIVLLVVGRLGARRAVRAHRARGEWVYRIVAAGSRDGVNHLIESTQRRSHAGLRVIGACLDDADLSTPLAEGVPVLGVAADAAAAAQRHGADAVALAGSTMSPYRIRELGWALEGAGRELIMSPGLTEVAGPRVHVSPVEGLPLMWVDQPQFTGMARVAKRVIDVAGAALILVLIFPLLAGVAAAVRLDSRGPILYRQQRMGRDGEPFAVCKFRTMVVGAHAQRRRCWSRTRMTATCSRSARTRG